MVLVTRKIWRGFPLYPSLLLSLVLINFRKLFNPFADGAANY